MKIPPVRLLYIYVFVQISFHDFVLRHYAKDVNKYYYIYLRDNIIYSLPRKVITGGIFGQSTFGYIDSVMSGGRLCNLGVKKGLTFKAAHRIPFFAINRMGCGHNVAFRILFGSIKVNDLKMQCNGAPNSRLN